MRRLWILPPALLVAVLLGPGPGLAQLPSPGPVRPAAGVWPLRPVPDVARSFDPPAQPWGAGHRGVDLLGRPGQRVRTALPGRVSFAGALAGRGVVVVDHGATRTTYEPVDAAVRVGQVVAAGEGLGALAVPGSHCLPRSCLHWGWLRGTVYLDPLALVAAGPMRLLPWEGAAPGPPALPRVGHGPAWSPPAWKRPAQKQPAQKQPAWSRWAQARGWAWA